MLKRLQDGLTARMMRHTFRNDDELYTYIISYIAAAFSCVVHAYLLAVFAVADEVFPACINAVSLLLNGGLVACIKRRKCTLIGLVISVEVTVYATIMGLLTGIGNYIIGNYLLVIIMQVILPYGTARVRTGVLIGVIACVTASIVFNMDGAPPMPLEPGLERIMLVSNVCILIVGALLELYVGNMLKIIIQNINSTRMAELSSAAYTDPLTGLYNRRYADDYLAALAAREDAPHYCVAMLDIDDFKYVNDTYGHPCGDEVLRFLAGFLKGNLRKADVVFRWGGEEFLIIQEDIDVPAAHSVLDRLREKLSSAVIMTAAAPLRITATIGVTALERADAYRSIAISDRNLYQGKQGGKNTVISG